MFSWLRKKKPAVPERTVYDLPPAGENPANPGRLVKANWDFSDGERNWKEEMDVPRSLRAVLEAQGHRLLAEDEGVLVDVDSGIALRPLLESMEPIHKKGVRTVTTIEIKHASRISTAIFEYQHSRGPDIESSLRDGFEQWYALDFAALLDAMRDEAISCQEMILPVGGDEPRQRRVTLGPVRYYRQNEVTEHEEHSFCPCCLFTNCFDSLKPAIDASGFQAVRLFASRDENGNVSADCRINGEDFEPGKAALIDYALGWPEAGFEFRKQYVIIQD